MREEPKKNPAPETDNKISNQNKQTDHPDTEDLPNAPVSQLVESFQKMKDEEQRLLEIKQQILTQQHDLQNELVKAIEKKKMTIANLISEIPNLQNKTQQLGQVLNIDIYK